VDSGDVKTSPLLYTDYVVLRNQNTESQPEDFILEKGR
jgi:hypothetical protein